MATFFVAMFSVSCYVLRKREEVTETFGLTDAIFSVSCYVLRKREQVTENDLILQFKA